MINRHTTFFVNEIKPLEFCGKIVAWDVGLNGAFELPFEIEPTTGEHDYTTCEGCKKTLTELTKTLTKKFNGNEQKKGFPFCCSHHSNLVKVKQFERAFFVNVPVMVVKKILYTNQHIINNHSSENWYKVITDYIEWAVESFGKMPNDCGESLYLSDYFLYVTDLLKRNKEMKAETKARLLEFLNKYQTPNESPKTDWNILLSTYQRWYKEFPFELNTYFGNLKQHFAKQLPILNGEPEVNIYSGLAKVKMHTKSSLIEALINLTDSILTQINGVTLYEKGLITDTNKIKIELVINSRKLKLKQGYVNSSPNEEQRYRTILKEWFADEKRFIDEITTLIKALPPQQNETKSDKLKAELGKYGFFELTAVKPLSEPNKQNLIELISSNDLPYNIAMFDYLGFLTHLKKEHFTINTKLHKEISRWFNSDKEGRAVKGNISTLLEYTTESKSRYTAHKHKETVKNNYQILK